MYYVLYCLFCVYVCYVYRLTFLLKFEQDSTPLQVECISKCGRFPTRVYLDIFPCVSFSKLSQYYYPRVILTFLTRDLNTSEKAFSSIMASQLQYKQCISCVNRICELDPHDECLPCLTTTHDSTQCADCQALPNQIYTERVILINETLANDGEWPHDHQLRLHTVELSVWHGAISSAEDKDDANEMKKLKLNRKRHQIDDPDVTEPVKKQRSDDLWKRGIESSLQQMASMLKQMQSTGRPSHTATPTNVEDLTKDHAVPGPSRPGNISSYKIPKKSSKKDESSHEDFADNEDESDSDPGEQDLGRIEKRRMFVRGLRDLVPQLTHPDQKNQSQSGYFNLLETKQKPLTMPFLSEIHEQASKIALNTGKKFKDPFRGFARFYPTTQPTEAGLLSPRVIPSELLFFVPASKLTAAGASGEKAELKKSSPEGAKEQAANVSYKQACGYLRLTNNLEIDTEVCQSLLEKQNAFIRDLQGLQMSDEVRSKTFDLVRMSRLMSTAIFDIKSTNNDFLKATLYQYQSAVQNKREAWLAASTVQLGNEKELKLTDFPQTSTSDPAEPLGVFGSKGLNVIKNYYQFQKDLSLTGARFQSPQHPWLHQGGRRGRGGRANQSFRGRGRGFAERGNHFRGRGRRGQQPFPQGRGGPDKK